jgi:hypothetical protein
MKKLPPENRPDQSGANYHQSVFEENLGTDHPHPHFDKAAFSWIAPEYLQHPKSIRWWVSAAIVLVIAIVLEALTGSWTMLAATLAFAGVFYFTHQYHPPRHTKINISELGLKIGHHRILFEEIEFFWIIYNPPEVKRLFIRIKDSLLPDLVIELEDQDPQAIRAFLERYLVEVTGVKEHFSDQLLRLFKL